MPPAMAEASGDHAADPLLRKLARRLPSRWRRPVIVVGNQKSGTSAIAALLGKATGRRYTIDIFFTLEEDEERPLFEGQLTFEEFVARHLHWFRHDIIKEPSFTFLYPHLRRVFPRARFVYILRDPLQNIRSILDRVGLPGNLEDLEEEHRARYRSLRQWRLFMEGICPPTDYAHYIDILAERWRLAADVYTSRPSDFHLVRYEDFRKEKKRTIEQLAADLGLKVVTDISAEVDRPYQQPGNPNVDLRAFFGDRNLERIARICGDHMDRLGYGRIPPAPAGVLPPPAG